MPYLVFDIETSPLAFEDLDLAQQEYLMRGAASDEEREERKRMMSLNPLTARVASLGMVSVPSLDAEPQGCVYSNRGDDAEEIEEKLPDGSIWKTMSERALLEKLWQVLEWGRTRGGSCLISFNGRGFDCPFLMLRSAVLRVKPSRNLMDGTRWRYDRHIDLQDELCFKGSDRNGAMRRFNFDFYCKSFGIKSPKSEGVSGYDVPDLWARGEHRAIAEYCMRDVWATWELFKFWKEYLNVEG